jgi:hypothetical protein
MQAFHYIYALAGAEFLNAFRLFYPTAAVVSVFISHFCPFLAVVYFIAMPPMHACDEYESLRYESNLIANFSKFC